MIQFPPVRPVPGPLVQEGAQVLGERPLPGCDGCGGDDVRLEDLETDDRPSDLQLVRKKNLQLLKYYGPQGLIESLPPSGGRAQRRDLRAIFRPQRRGTRVLFWNEGLPAYYRDTSFHQHAPGVWPGIADALSYEYATTYFSFSLEAADVPYRSLADLVGRLVGVSRRARVLDVGTGYGKLAFVLKADGARLGGVRDRPVDPPSSSSARPGRWSAASTSGSSGTRRRRSMDSANDSTRSRPIGCCTNCLKT